MIERSAATADLQAVRQRAGDVALGGLCRVGQCMPERETGSDRGRERATASMRVPRLHSRRRVLVELLVVQQHIDDRRTGPVTAGNNHGARPHALDAARRFARRDGRRDPDC